MTAESVHINNGRRSEMISGELDRMTHIRTVSEYAALLGPVYPRW